MSIHAQQTPEALARLKRQQRTASLTSIVIALLVIVLIGLVLALLVLAPLIRVNPVIVTYAGPATQPEEKMEMKTKITQLKPQAPPSSSHAARVITAAVTSPTAIPTVDVEIQEPTVEFGSGDDFGDGLFDSGGSGGGMGGGSTGFGSTLKISGALTGALYDFKQDRRGNDFPAEESDPSRFSEIVDAIQRRNFSRGVLARYYKAPLELSLTNLAIPQQPASEGPRYFGAEQYMEPRMWMAHYSGDVVALEPGTYRFVGMADDIESVFIDGDPTLVGHRPDMGDEVLSQWKVTEESGKWPAPYGGIPLVVGDWVTFKEGQKRHMDLAIGERPGGYLHFVLMVQKKGEKYRTGAGGRPILPLFTTSFFNEEDAKAIRKRFGSYEFEWEKVPVFPAQ
ncbi:hypothetical protein [Haloferula sargassicola]|uniref:PA14 domain-containing protein n=1 Tax=Haloferula sargassicola TaxID=490096 RepID=A0ABP9UPS0_9BACT